VGLVGLVSLTHVDEPRPIRNRTVSASLRCVRSWQPLSPRLCRQLRCWLLPASRWKVIPHGFTAPEAMRHLETRPYRLTILGKHEPKVAGDPLVSRWSPLVMSGPYPMWQRAEPPGPKFLRTGLLPGRHTKGAPLEWPRRSPLPP
jgi:hypothetical protein